MKSQKANSQDKTKNAPPVLKPPTKHLRMKKDQGEIPGLFLYFFFISDSFWLTSDLL